jgi:hypothetical protein
LTRVWLLLALRVFASRIFSLIEFSLFQLANTFFPLSARLTCVTSRLSWLHVRKGARRAERIYFGLHYYHTWPRPQASQLALRVLNHQLLDNPPRAPKFHPAAFCTCFCLDHSGCTHVFFGLQQGLLLHASTLASSCSKGSSSKANSRLANSSRLQRSRIRGEQL